MTCDRQGCTKRAMVGEYRTLEDGCIVKICPECARHFREEGARPGVYFHAHSINEN